MATEERAVDEKGRVTIPQRVRESLGIEPGSAVTIEVTDGEIVVRPRVSREVFVSSMAGVVNEESRRSDATATDPLELKADWTSDLEAPSDR
jgi:AbrB family looped-hinge helix DNA binding protein